MINTFWFVLQSVVELYQEVLLPYFFRTSLLLCLKVANGNGVDLHYEVRLQQVVSSSAQAINYSSHRLLLHRVAPLNVIELVTFKGYGMPILYQNPLNGEIKGIHVYLKHLTMVKECQHQFLHHCFL